MTTCSADAGVYRHGNIAAGQFADIIAANTGPVCDVRAVENVSFVMKDGQVYEQ